MTSRRRAADAPAVEPLLPGAIETYLARRIPVCAPSDLVGAVRLGLHRQVYDSAADVAVCDGGRLLGLISAERLLAADDDVPAEELMDPDPPVVAPGVDQEVAAWKAVQHGESSLAVVDADGTLRGLVPPARLMGVLLQEHEADLMLLSGMTASTASARQASEESLGLRLRHRTPWLVIGLLGSAAAAYLMGGFEETLSADLRLAFFVPGVVYMADAVGTQTEALVIRGLSIGVSIRRTFRLELLTGLALGVLMGLCAFPAVWWAFGSADLALAVAVSLFAACAVATVIAMALPWVMSRIGRDPAYGSGPLATVVQDLLSLVIYFVVATTLVI
jgi:magnesium transporter